MLNKELSVNKILTGGLLAIFVIAGLMIVNQFFNGYPQFWSIKVPRGCFPNLSGQNPPRRALYLHEEILHNYLGVPVSYYCTDY